MPKNKGFSSFRGEKKRTTLNVQLQQAPKLSPWHMSDFSAMCI